MDSYGATCTKALNKEVRQPADTPCPTLSNHLSSFKYFWPGWSLYFLPPKYLHGVVFRKEATCACRCHQTWMAGKSPN